MKAAALLAAWLLVDAPPPPSVTSSPDPLMEAEVRAIGETLALAPGDDLHVSVVWADCGEENAAYDPAKQIVYMCTEDSADPGWATFAAAHEAGHALTEQLDLPLDESPWAKEVAADELAALALLKAGDPADVLAAASFHAQDPDPPEGDPHPPGLQRAFHLSCMATGATPWGSPYCQTLYAQVRAKWNAAIAVTPPV